MKCAFSECKNKTDMRIGWGNAKGSIPICKECLEIYNRHIRAKSELQLEKVIELIKKNWW